MDDSWRGLIAVFKGRRKSRARHPTCWLHAPPSHDPFLLLTFCKYPWPSIRRSATCKSTHAPLHCTTPHAHSKTGPTKTLNTCSFQRMRFFLWVGAGHWHCQFALPSVYSSQNHCKPQHQQRRHQPQQQRQQHSHPLPRRTGAHLTRGNAAIDVTNELFQGHEHFWGVEVITQGFVYCCSCLLVPAGVGCCGVLWQGGFWGVVQGRGMMPLGQRTQGTT